MNRKIVPSEHNPNASSLIDRLLAYAILLVWCSTAMLSQNPSVPVSVAGSPGIRVTHVLGLEGVSGNATGNLTIEDNTLQFQKSGGATNQVSIASIQAVFLGEQSKQVGGLPMKTAWMEAMRSEEHTSELQSRLHLVCRLLLEKKNRQVAALEASAPMSPRST